MLAAGFLEAHAELLGREADSFLIGEFEDEVGPNAHQIRIWLDLPESSRPTGFAMGSGNKAWQALELCLAEIGCKLADSPGSYSAAGITSSPFALMFGDAQVYQGIEVDHLARLVTPALIHTTEGNGDSSRINRYRPGLTQAASLDISVRVPLAICQAEREEKA
jgi:hypothetical protein